MNDNNRNMSTEEALHGVVDRASVHEEVWMLNHCTRLPSVTPRTTPLPLHDPTGKTMGFTLNCQEGMPNSAAPPFPRRQKVLIFPILSSPTLLPGKPRKTMLRRSKQTRSPSSRRVAVLKAAALQLSTTSEFVSIHRGLSGIHRSLRLKQLRSIKAT